MGGGISQLSEDQVKTLTEQTPFDPKDLAKLLKRYAYFDQSEKGDIGITVEELLKIPELTGYSLVPAVAQQFLTTDSGKFYPEQFIYLFAALSSKTPIEKKRELVFQVADIGRQGVLNKNDLIEFLNILYDGALPAKEIEDLAEETVQREDLEVQGQLSRADFDKLVSDAELKEILTIDLQLH